MKARALVIDDNAAIIRDVEDILDSLDHSCDSVGDQDAARKLLGADKYAYILLDLEIPVKPGKLSRIQNGVNLLVQIRTTPGMENVPVIVMTGHGEVPVQACLGILKRAGYDGTLSIEFEGMENPVDGIAISLENLRRFEAAC